MSVWVSEWVSVWIQIWVSDTGLSVAVGVWYVTHTRMHECVWHTCVSARLGVTKLYIGVYHAHVWVCRTLCWATWTHVRMPQHWWLAVA